ncbi:MAG: bifunctional UDP-N-acetylmuramoyl-tripeptide:D-alanyl-D-alanine ligase/alanine racemase [Bacteroidia bacterium]|nr:bifunctional UDP-N-acetylmuramoyl-tripeptide:D-alanyl-D-alanine ligase/alanine racemase [Bacteroidia bacterium]
MHRTYTCEEIAQLLSAQLHGEKSLVIHEILLDSRKLSSIEGALFVAIKGLRHNGHLYIPELYNKGIRVFLVSDITFKPEHFPGSCFIQVSDTLLALQKLSKFHRQQFRYPVIGITGSNGKTIVKEWLYTLLQEDYSIVRSPKSFNSQIGVPLSVWEMEEQHNLALFEAGISLPGEMDKLESIISPTIGIFTNIGQPHSENFKDLEQKTREKLRLFKHVKKLIFCKDYDDIYRLAMPGENLESDCKLFTWSRRTKADLAVTKVSKNKGETEISGIFDYRFISISIPFSDEASIENAIHCWAFLLSEGYSNEIISQRMSYLSPVAMRLELKEGVNNCSIINDSYNSDLGSLAVALDFLNQQHQHPTKTLVLSDILQSGKGSDQLYHEVAELIHTYKIDKLIGIGTEITKHQALFNLNKQFFSDTDSFLEKSSSNSFQNEAILLKGARSFGFEEITKFLQQKAHETVMEINLDAMVHNLNYYRSLLSPGTKLMTMVKAYSYGSGGHEIASLLQFHRVDYLTVAYADEGVELRKAGISLPILVMNPEEQSFDAMIKYKLEPELYSFRILGHFERALQRNTDRILEPISIHIKLDTGMHRLGFEAEDINELIIRLKNLKRVKVVSLFSHLAASEDQAHDRFTNGQINLFKKMSEEIISHLGYPVLRHILNSSGITRFPDAQFDMVRLGIGLYGVASNSAEQRHLRNVSSLKTIISQIKYIKPGDSVGYGRKEMVVNPETIATVPIGYADGLSRVLGNRKGRMLVNGKMAPIVGSVCMDMCMLDITGISCKEGDSVTVFGEGFSISDLAALQGTIPYEILTGVSRRVKRVYYRE